MPDVERGDWHDDPEYPNGPLPAHERVWRHPSEIGASQWATSEPPLVVGRGLSVATGTVGAALAVGLLWLMIPHHTRSGVSAGASATSVRVTTDDSDATLIATGSGHTPFNGSLGTTVTTNFVVPPVTTVQQSAAGSTPNTNPGDAPAHATMLLSSGSLSATGQSTAVALTPGHFVITTAQAVNGRQSLEVVLASGETVVGAVILVDRATGTAVLSIPTEIEALAVGLSPEPSQSTGVIMMSPEPMLVNVVANNTRVLLTYDRDINLPEGSLVLDQKGRLLGMCTVSLAGVTLVSVDAMLNALDTAATVRVPGWLGVRPEANEGKVAVGAVLIDGPAAVSGVRPGDVVEAIDGVPIMTLDGLGQVIAAHAAGDSVMLRLLRPGEAVPVVIRITLSSHPQSM